MNCTPQKKNKYQINLCNISNRYCFSALSKIQNFCMVHPIFTFDHYETPQQHKKNITRILIFEVFFKNNNKMKYLLILNNYAHTYIHMYVM